MTGALKVAKAGLSTVLAVKEAAALALHPVQWLKDKLIETVAAALLESLTRTVGPELARHALDKLSVADRTFPYELEVPVPEKAQSLLDGDGLQVAQDVANEVLAGPLELLGYRLAKVAVRFDQDQSRLVVSFEAGLMRTAPAQLSQSVAAPAAGVASPGSAGSPAGTAAAP